MAIIYGLSSVFSLVALVLYLIIINKKSKWMILLYSSISIANFGYFLLAISKTLEFAIFANKVAYFGSVFLSMFMFLSILDLCNFKYKKILPISLFVTGGVMFGIVCTIGYLPWYYESISMELVDGAIKLVKEYGPLHISYTIYVIVYFMMMVTAIVMSISSNKVSAKKHATLLVAVVFGNLIVWFVEKFIPVDFEFLSVSYLMSEFVFLSVGWMMEDYVQVKKNSQTTIKGMSSIDDITDISKKDQIKILLSRVSEDKPLTSREYEILICILDNKKRKEIAKELNVSENTIKTHMSHLYEKLNVSSREEIWGLLYK